MQKRIVSLLAFLLASSRVDAATEPGSRLQIIAVDPKPKSERAPLDVAELARLEAEIAASPRLRKPRQDLVHALVRAGRLQEALAAASEWRAHDAYNLVAVRALGDVQSSLGDKARAQRTYSAIVELLPKDVEARRAVATLLKAAGDLEGARLQLEAALELAPEDRRTAFELADVEQRLGKNDEAEKRFRAVIDASEAPEALRYPARQRLSQIYAKQRLAALANKDAKAASALEHAIRALDVHGGSENDIKVYLSWDTDRTDVDLWVFTPAGEKIFYSHREGRQGEALHDDVTTGYGPETFTAHRAQPGEYKVVVDYYGAHEAGKEARGEIIVVVNEGRVDEERKVFPYRLFDQKDSVMLARVKVGGGK
jgi:tetratricopeptide (TPR) repeat protein